MSKKTWLSPAVLVGLLFIVAALLVGCTVTTPQGEVIEIPAPSSSVSASSAELVSPAAPAATDMHLIAANSVDRAMMLGAPQGSAQQVAETRAVLMTATTDAVQQLTAAGVDLSDEDKFNEFVGIVHRRAEENGLFCWASNLGPENEIQGAGVQRRELSTSGLLHVDHYNSPDLPSVSILVGEGEFAILAGFGSMFEFPWDRCGQYDFKADAEKYAENRREVGHSGVVFCTLWDALNGALPCVNLWGLSNSEIDALRPNLWQENPANTAAVRAITGSTVDPREQACGAAQITPHPPTHGEQWVVSGPAVVSFWSNWPDMQTPQGVEYKLLVPEGTTVALRGGGTSWTYPAGCGDVASAQYAENGLAPLDARYIVQ